MERTETIQMPSTPSVLTNDLQGILRRFEANSAISRPSGVSAVCLQPFQRNWKSWLSAFLVDT